MTSFTKNYLENLKGFHKKKINEVVILLYHGVTKIKSYGVENYSCKHMMDNVFFEQMKFLKMHCNPISINDYVDISKNGDKLPPNSVIITFDDGFRNNFTVAAPILDELRIPAIFYISSGIVNTNLMFWVDIIEDCINNTKKAYINLKLDKPRQFLLNNSENKIKAIELIKAYCKSVSVINYSKIINSLEQKTKVKAKVENSVNYQKISWEELKLLESNKLFEIGGHSLYHNILSALNSKQLKREIRASLDLLELNLGKKILHYSYPEGQSNHYNNEVIDCLKHNGIICSPSAIPGLNSRKADLFNLKRIMVGISNLPFPYYQDKL